MADDIDRYRGFSTPHLDFDEAFMQDVAATHYRRALRTFVSRHDARLEERGARGLGDLLRRWFDSPVCFETAWHIAFGRMREVLAYESTPADVALAAARLGLRLCETGATGRWSIPLEGAARFRFGRFVLPACDGLEVVADADVIALTLTASGERASLELRRTATGEWQLEGDGAARIPTFDTGSRRVGLLYPDTPEGRENMEHELVVDADEERAIMRGYRSAFDVLREHAPRYIPWVNRLLRHLVPVKPAPGGYIGGGSLRDNPGTVKLPYAQEPVELAANLAHECAHQHYFLLRCAGRVDDGSDTNLYFSPFVGVDRDLATILLTYHAFANECLVLRRCELAGAQAPVAGARAALLRETLVPLEEILERGAALTPMGQALWQSARDELRRAFS